GPPAPHRRGGGGAPAVMLYLLLYPLHVSYPPLNVFKYITFRTLVAGLAALTLSLVLGPMLIRRLSALQIGQAIRSDGPATHPDLGLWYVPFGALVVVGAANAVNLTDGLDGLAIGPVMIAGGTYAVFAYTAGHAKIAEYLQIPFVPGAGELAVFCGALAAAGLGFLWFNAYPAQMFMGDVGSLALSSALGIVALITRQELVLVLVGGVFVGEALSVI